MKKQKTENREPAVEKTDAEGDASAHAEISAEDQAALETKPKAKARKKKAVEVVETGAPEVVSEPAPEVAKAKRAKKAVAKTATEQESSELETEALKVAKAGKKKDKGRDLVVDEPGAKEIAEILDHPSTEQAAEQSEEDEKEDAVVDKGPEPKLERLQKILAKAGVASRRAAEELILGGRVQINGKVVMELGTKADPARDHVRVDGKLLQGPERTRYFVLNKPKGYVTTVSDPEGRPTVMQFFSSERERLYPVGRLDYLSEGLLLVTNDGELANKLTKASSGVEKTYLVKVAGQPSEEGLDALRSGVVIERGRGIGSGRVRTAPAQIRQVRQGDNPWYEVIIIEGRNRELRKMFEEIGHHVEKIRRVGYGPLILDLEPGKLRELEAEEVHSLRLAAEGKLKTRRRRGPQQAQLPTVAGKTVRYKKADGKPGFEPRRAVTRPEFQTESKAEFKPEFRAIPKSSFKPKPSFKPGGNPKFRSESGYTDRPGTKPAFKQGFKSGAKPAFGAGPAKPYGSKPSGKPEFSTRGNFAGKPRRVEPPVTDYVLPPRKSSAHDEGEARPSQPERQSGPRPAQSPRFTQSVRNSAGGLPVGRRMGAEAPGKPAGRQFNKPFRAEKPRPDFSRPKPQADDDYVPTKTPGFRIEPVIETPREERPRSGGFSRSAQGGKFSRPATGRPSGGDRPFRPREDRPDRPFSGGKTFRPRTDRPAEGRGSAPSGGRPFRPRGEFASGGAPRSGSRPASGERPPRFAPRTDGQPARGPKTFEGGSAGREDRPREFRPRPGGAPPKKFAGSRPSAAKPGPDGEPRKKERWRNSFTGKNKGRPKPKPKKAE